MAYPLSNYLFSLSSFTAEKNLSPPLALSYSSLSVFHSSSPALALLWSGFIQTCSLFIGTASKGVLV